MAVSYPRTCRVLVVAPHPDDDAIGCGGILARLARSGARISVTYVTDGSASHLKSKRFPPPVLRDVREAEARSALRRLGVGVEPEFLRAPDSGLATLDAAAIDRLADAIARRIDAGRIGTLFAPWLRDPHPDHAATAAIVGAALTRSTRLPQLIYYGVWLSIRGGETDRPAPDEVQPLSVRVQPRDLARKRAAILAHRSQTGMLIDDDPAGFCIDSALLARWLVPVERFYRPARALAGTRKQC